MDILGLDSLSIAFLRFRMPCLSSEEFLDKVTEHLLPAETQKEGRCLLTKLKSFREEIITLQNIVCLRLTDVFLALTPSEAGNHCLDMTLLSMIEKYYGKHHPRSILQIIRTALIVRDAHVRLQLLNRALSLAQVWIPFSSEGCAVNNKESGIFKYKSRDPYPTLLTAIESLLKEAREGIQCKVSIKNKQEKLKNQQIIAKAPHIRSSNSMSFFSNRSLLHPMVRGSSSIHGSSHLTRLSGNKKNFFMDNIKVSLTRLPYY